MFALSIRQPYAELILRGEKTIEYRSRPTRRIGERFYIYASKQWAGVDGDTVTGWHGDKVNGTSAKGHPLTRSPFHPLTQLPTGLIVGTAVISHVTRIERSQAGRLCHQWHLKDVRRLARPRKPKRFPQPVWFRPF
jgi:hypothetical protein